MSKITYENLQSWVEMLIDALENKGASNSGVSDEKVYHYAQKYRDYLVEIRNKKVSRYYLDHFLRTNHEEIMALTVQKYRVQKILEGIKIYFYKEFMKR